MHLNLSPANKRFCKENGKDFVFSSFMKDGESFCNFKVKTHIEAAELLLDLP